MQKVIVKDSNGRYLYIDYFVDDGFRFSWAASGTVFKSPEDAKNYIDRERARLNFPLFLMRYPGEKSLTELVEKVEK